eukprot:CAMPEP_0206428716 /NCGR_PEP_ID=MMETSP0324_2-20121206/5830_1 /ASSEMBLY_ACC=CAM_ASM_000836 /TAXON_ID=2866 /ORGANISM="Crypthecodinium cohnii, Strain Seligo" /LENGTH=145 /DNA_ID=CAMNT_0053894297 /DNA_START=62 /DNA_END=499 /DNA_ORIENTATION=+
MGQASGCCSCDDGGDQMQRSEVKGPEDDSPPEIPSVPLMPAAAAKVPVKPGEVPERAPQPLRVEFRTLENEERVVLFTQQPLGLDFNKTNPIMMKRVQPGGHGHRLGVRMGWQVIGVNGEDVSMKDFDYTYQLLKQASSALPLRS